MNSLFNTRPLPILMLTALLGGCQLANLQPGPIATLEGDTATEPTPVMETSAHSATDERAQAVASSVATTDTVNASSTRSKQAPQAKPQPPKNLWQRISAGYQLQGVHHPRVEAELKRYLKHPNRMRKVSRRAELYLHYVTEQLQKHQLPLELALLPIIESDYDPFAYSSGGAAGIWQFMPATGRVFDLHQNWWYDGRRDIVSSTDAAISYLKQLNGRFDGDWPLTLAAYNAGRGRVNKAIRKNKQRGKAVDYWSLDLPRETRRYVPKLLALSKLIGNPKRYNFAVPDIANRPRFAVVKTGSQLDLAQAAELAGISEKTIHQLNPGFKRWATSPEGPHRLVLPLGKTRQFKRQLAKLPKSERMQWQRYRIKKGDSLLRLAKRFHIDVSTIKHLNRLSSNTIRAGKTLMLPMAPAGYPHGYTAALKSAKRPPSLAATRSRLNLGDKTFHRVRSGENLWTISRRYKISSARLAQWNGLKAGDLLKPGQQLRIKAKTVASTDSVNSARKVGYTVRNGDSLAAIASRYNLRISDIVKWNAINPKKYLQPGQLLTLYTDAIGRINP